jgi:hypothetical protein
MRTPPDRKLCLALGLSIVLHAAAFILFLTGTRLNPVAPRHVLSVALLRPVTTIHPDVVPAPPGGDFALPRNASPEPMAPRNDAPDPLAGMAASREARLLTPVDDKDWPQLPELTSGRFELELFIGSDGRVQAVVPRCEESLCPAAEAYAEVVRDWDFEPAARDGQLVTAHLRISFDLGAPPPPPPPAPARAQEIRQ